MKLSRIQQKGKGEEAVAGEGEVEGGGEGEEVDVENQKKPLDVESVDGFAEIFPEDKHLIVEILQKKGYVVGMTGDGANVGLLTPLPSPDSS